MSNAKISIDAILDKRPPFLLLAFPLILIAMLVALAVWLWLSFVDIVTPAVGTLIPKEKIKVVDAAAPSIIREIHVEDGSQVAKGQPLIAFLDIEASATAQQSRDDLAVNQHKLWRLKALLQLMASDDPEPQLLDVLKQGEAEPGLALEAAILDRQWQAHQAQAGQARQEIASLHATQRRSREDIERLKANLPFLQDKQARSQRLYDLGAVSRQTLEDAQQALVDHNKAILVEQGKYQEAMAALGVKQEALKVLQSDFQRDASIELSQTQAEIARLEQDLIKSEQTLTQQVITAPIAGTVTELVEHTEGGVVSTGDVLMKIVPMNRRLEMEAKVPTTEVGFVSPGQRVRIKIDTFEFTKYGYIDGTVSHISANAVRDEELGGFVYKAMIAMDKNSMRVDGRQVALVPGMSGTVDIQTGKRRLAEYVIAPFLRYRDEAMRER